MKRFLHVILHPFLLSLWVTLLLLLVLPLKTPKYSCLIADKGSRSELHVSRYSDLDGDGNSEVISTFHNSLGNAGMTVSNTHGVLNQWNFRGNFGFTLPTGLLQTADRDHNGIREVYVFTLSNDSVLLHEISDYRNPTAGKRNIFVCTIGKRKGKTDPYLVEGEPEDLTGDGTEELIFIVGTGYSLQPRQLFAYDAVRDTFLRSPESGYFINMLLQADITGDKTREIFPFGYAAGNVYDTLLPFPDSMSWFMALDKNLDFVFQPLSFQGAYSELIPFAAMASDGTPMLGAMYIPPLNSGLQSQLYTLDVQGNLVDTVTLRGRPSQIVALHDNKGRLRFVVNCRNESIALYSDQFSLIRHIAFDRNVNLSLFDADLDGETEILGTDILKMTLTIFRSDLSHPVTIPLEGNGIPWVIFSTALSNGQNPSLYVQYGSSFQKITYGINPAYPFRFVKYAGVYAAILLFTLLVQKIQRDQIRRKQEIEQKITDLQLRIVRNQLDPHFTLNAINSVISGISEGRREEAKAQLLHFSSLHRSLLLDSDRTRRPLEEEITFTKNYLALEKFRFGDRFTYQFDIDPAANIRVEVPKMMLQVYVENALKHGLLPLKSQGLLFIRISGDPPVVEIRDNGIGRQASASRAGDHTGKGMNAMQQTYDLFGKLGYGHIEAVINDLTDTAGNPAGTAVTLTIHSNHEKRNASPPP